MLKHITNAVKIVVTAFKNEAPPEHVSPAAPKKVSRNKEKVSRDEGKALRACHKKVSIPGWLHQISQAPQGSKILLNMKLATNPSYRKFRERLVAKHCVLSSEVILDNSPKRNNLCVQITLDSAPKTADQQYPVLFRHRTHSSKPVYEFTEKVYNGDLVRSLLPEHHLPERAEFLTKLQAAAPLVSVGYLFDMCLGITQTTAKNLANQTNSIKARVILASTITKNRFIRDNFSEEYIDIARPNTILPVTKGDILISTLQSNARGTHYALVVNPVPANTYHNHVVIRLRPKKDVDPRMAHVFYTLWTNEKYRQLYPFVLGSIPGIQIGELGKMPFPNYKDEQILDAIDQQVSKALELDTQQQSANQALLGIL